MIEIIGILYINQFEFKFKYMSEIEIIIFKSNILWAILRIKNKTCSKIQHKIHKKIIASTICFLTRHLSTTYNFIN